jgi:sulfite reductase (ferredoxin)
MYKLPETLESDIQKFASLAKNYQDKKIESVQFKASRVPMGIYEQRQDDVYMSRIRTTGGVIGPKQFLKVIEIARRNHSDLLHVTTRQEIQVQNLQLHNVEPILLELQKIGLSTKGGGGNTVRNIMVSEFSGIDPDEQFDTTPYAIELTTRLIAEPDSYLLPRKLKIAFSSNDKQIGYAAVNDIGLVAKTSNREKGFYVYAGGGAGAKPTIGWKLFDFVPASELYIVAKSLKKFFSEHGNRKNRHKARLRFIFYRLGEQETIRLIREYYEAIKEEKTLPFVINDQWEERPPSNYQPTNEKTDANFESWKKRYVISQKHAGYSTILIPLLLGNIPIGDADFVSRFQRLLTFVDQFGDHTIRFTSSQSIRLRNIPNLALPELYLILKDIFEELHLPTLINNIVACTGADTCRLGIGLSKGLATAIRKKLVTSNLNLDKLQDAKINISGCPNSCGQQLWADIGFSGKILRNNRIFPGYQVYLGARRDAEPCFGQLVGNISARDIPGFIERIFTGYLKEEKNGSFQNYIQGEGKSTVLKLLAEYKEIPSFDEDKNYYFDWGAETIFSIVNRGTAECSAGLFDMIDVDQNIINNTKLALEKELDQLRRNIYLYEILFSASRMLLITRGVEPKTTEDVFNLFLKNFVEYGFVNEKFREIITIGRDDRNYFFEDRKDDIFALADAVSDLYKNMDDSLQFKNIQPQKLVSESDKKADRKKPEIASDNHKLKDLRGVSCPMNFVQTKIQLSPMQSGEILEIWLDEGQPINNVPGSVRSEGHEVLEQIQVGDYWKVVIKKK